jgi:hypothetical protein
MRIHVANLDPVTIVTIVAVAVVRTRVLAEGCASVSRIEVAIVARLIAFQDAVTTNTVLRINSAIIACVETTVTHGRIWFTRV